MRLHGTEAEEIHLAQILPVQVEEVGIIVLPRVTVPVTWLHPGRVGNRLIDRRRSMSVISRSDYSGDHLVILPASFR